MKSPGRKKKADKQSSTEAKDQSIIELPKNLLAEKSEPEKVTNPLVAKEEEKTVSEPKVDLPAVEAKTETDEVKSEVKTETVLSQSQSDSALPPISVPISQAEPLSSEDKPSNKSFLWIIVAILVILLVVGGGWFYLSNKSNNEVKKTEKETSMKPTMVKVQPTQVASEEAKLDKYPIKVLNGSGIAGEATKLQEILEKDGFAVSETGNAEKYTYADTIIQAKKSVEKTFLEKLSTLIGKSHSLGKAEALSASDSSDVVVVVGSKKAGD